MPFGSNTTFNITINAWGAWGLLGVMLGVNASFDRCIFIVKVKRRLDP
jgi:hypothetical protein